MSLRSTSQETSRLLAPVVDESQYLVTAYALSTASIVRCNATPPVLTVVDPEGFFLRDASLGLPGR